MIVIRRVRVSAVASQSRTWRTTSRGQATCVQTCKQILLMLLTCVRTIGSLVVALPLPIRISAIYDRQRVLTFETVHTPTVGFGLM
jgi:hypothetical protein